MAVRRHSTLPVIAQANKERSDLELQKKLARAGGGGGLEIVGQKRVSHNFRAAD